MPRQENIVYKVNWDNGASACGTFPYEFETEEDAENYGDDWVYKMSQVDPDGEYSFDVIEDESRDTEGEGWDVIGELPDAGLSRGRA